MSIKNSYTKNTCKYNIKYHGNSLNVSEMFIQWIHVIMNNIEYRAAFRKRLQSFKLFSCHELLLQIMCIKSILFIKTEWIDRDRKEIKG